MRFLCTCTVQGKKSVASSGCSHPGGLTLNTEDAITRFLGLNIPVCDIPSWHPLALKGRGTADANPGPSLQIRKDVKVVHRCW